MKRLIILLIISFANATMTGQELDETTFDFWIGNWNVSWQDQDGKTVTGSNEILRTVNKKVIQENFYDPNTNFKGTSISVYNPVTKIWHQAWADSNGSYFDLSGDYINGNPVFTTKMLEKDGEKIIQRMVFKNIEKDSFTWVWEGTKNGGLTWNELWKIQYNRT